MMEIILKILGNLVVIVAIFLALCGLIFTVVAFLVPTSAPYQYEQWNSTVVGTFLGINITQLFIIRLQIAAIGLTITAILTGVAWFLWGFKSRL